MNIPALVAAFLPRLAILAGLLAAGGLALAAPPDEVSPVPAPQWVGAVDVRGQAQLTWIRNAQHHQVRVYRRRADRDEEPFSPIGQTKGNTFLDARVEPGVAYRYRLTGIGADGREGKPSAELGVRIAPITLKPPTIPVLEGYILLEDGIGIKWSARAGEDIIAYNIYRRTSPFEAPVLVGSTRGTSYRDAPLAPGRTYTYSLTALDSSFRETPPSAELEVAFRPRPELPEAPVEETWRVRRTRLVALVTAGDMPLLRPADVAVGPVTGSVYLADSGRRRVFVFSPQGVYRRSLGVGSGGVGPFGNVLGLGMDAQENLYIVDAGPGQVVIVGPDGVLKQRIAVDPQPPERATGLIDIAVVAGGGLSIVDNLNNRVSLAAPQGDLRWFGQPGSRAGEFSAPTFCAADGEGNLYVAEALNGRVQVFTAGGEFLRSFGRYDRGPGGLGRPKGVAVAASGEVYVADSWLGSVKVFDPAGRFVAILGDESGRPLELGSPNGIALGPGNLIVVAERLSSRMQLRTILDAP